MSRPFVNTRLFSPVVLDGGVKSYPDRQSIEFEPWWYEQRRRCLEGYSVGGVEITGYHYWYLNFWSIYGLNYKTGRKGIINPRFTDLDYEKFDLVKRMYEEDKDCLIMKARQRGFSEWIAAIFGCDFCLIPASVLVIVAGQADYSEKTFTNTTRGLDLLEPTEFYKRRNPDRMNDYIRAAYTDSRIDSEGKKRKQTKGFLSEVYCLTALTNPQIVSRLSPSKIVFEEGGKWKRGRLKETFRFVQPSLKAEGKKTGWAFFVCTGGDMDESVQDVEHMFYNPDEYNLLTFDNEWEDDENAINNKVCYFVPAWKYNLIDEDGNSLKESSVKKIKVERSLLKGANLYRTMTQEPLTPSEGFMISSGGFFGDMISQWLNQRKAYINNHKEAQVEQRGYLHWKNPRNKLQGVRFKPNDDGNILIYRRPIKDKDDNVPEFLYKGATDSYDQDEAHTSSSKGSCQIMLGFLDAHHESEKWVARITERPTTKEGGSEKFYEDTAKLCVYYNAVNLIEFSKIRIIDWYVNNGLEIFLKERPQFVTASWIKKSMVTNRYGIDPATKPHWLKALRDFLSVKENIDKMDDIEQIEALARFVYRPADIKYNCDITISSALNIVCLEDEKEFIVQSSEVKKHRFLSFTSSGSGFNQNFN